MPQEAVPPRASAVATVMVPTRPMNMSAHRAISALGGRSAVIPVDRPTVEKADMHSNRISSRGRGLIDAI